MPLVLVPLGQVGVESEGGGRVLKLWILASGITALGFSYRLDPEGTLTGAA